MPKGWHLSPDSPPAAFLLCEWRGMVGTCGRAGAALLLSPVSNIKGQSQQQQSSTSLAHHNLHPLNWAGVRHFDTLINEMDDVWNKLIEGLTDLCSRTHSGMKYPYNKNTSRAFSLCSFMHPEVSGSASFEPLKIFLIKRPWKSDAFFNSIDFYDDIIIYLNIREIAYFVNEQDNNCCISLQSWGPIYTIISF